MDLCTVTFTEETTGLNRSDGNATYDVIWDIPTKYILGILMSIFIGMSLIGNILVIIVVSRQHGMFTRTNIFLCNLAVADLLAGVTLMPTALTTLIAGKWILNDAMCQINGFLAGFLLTCSIHTLMYIAVHKYASITKPLKKIITRKRVYIMLAAAWIWAGLAGYVRVHGLGTVGYKPYHTQCAPDYPKDLPSYLSVVFVAVFVFAIPFFVMLFCYARIFKEIKSYAARLSECTNQKQEEIYRQQRRSTLTLCIILVVFLLCFSPYIAYCIFITMVKNKNSIPKYLNAFVSKNYGLDLIINNKNLFHFTKSILVSATKLFCLRPRVPFHDEDTVERMCKLVGTFDKEILTRMKTFLFVSL